MFEVWHCWFLSFALVLTKQVSVSQCGSWRAGRRGLVWQVDQMKVLIHFQSICPLITLQSSFEDVVGLLTAIKAQSSYVDSDSVHPSLFIPSTPDAPYFMAGEK